MTIDYVISRVIWMQANAGRIGGAMKSKVRVVQATLHLPAGHCDVFLTKL
jgi:hypothetical protein